MMGFILQAVQNIDGSTARALEWQDGGLKAISPPSLLRLSKVTRRICCKTYLGLKCRLFEGGCLLVGASELLPLPRALLCARGPAERERPLYPVKQSFVSGNRIRRV